MYNIAIDGPAGAGKSTIAKIEATINDMRKIMLKSCLNSIIFFLKNETDT